MIKRYSPSYPLVLLLLHVILSAPSCTAISSLETPIDSICATCREGKRCLAIAIGQRSRAPVLRLVSCTADVIQQGAAAARMAVAGNCHYVMPQRVLDNPTRAIKAFGKLVWVGGCSWRGKGAACEGEGGDNCWSEKHGSWYACLILDWACLCG